MIWSSSLSINAIKTQNMVATWAFLRAQNAQMIGEKIQFIVRSKQTSKNRFCVSQKLLGAGLQYSQGCKVTNDIFLCFYILIQRTTPLYKLVFTCTAVTVWIVSRSIFYWTKSLLDFRGVKIQSHTAYTKFLSNHF